MKKLLKNRPITFKMILFICSGVLLTFIVIFSYSYFVSKDILNKTIDTNANLLTAKTAAEIDIVLADVEKVPQSLSLLLSENEYNEEQLFTLIRLFLKNNPQVFGIAIAYEPYTFNRSRYYYSPYVYHDNAGIQSSFLGSDDYNYTQMDWFQIPRELNKAYWTEPYYDEGGGNILMSTFSMPFYKMENGKKVFRGIVTSDVSLERLTQIISNVRVYETGYSFVVSRFGTIVAHPVKEKVVNESIFSLAEEGKSPELREMGRMMTSGKTGAAKFSYHDLLTGKLSWIFYAPINRNGWSVAVIYPLDELMADVNRLSAFILFLAICGVVLLVGVIIFVSSSITKPLRSLAGAVKNMAGGDFAIELQRIDDKDEVGELNRSFISMQSAIQEYIKNLTKATAEKEKIESELRIAHEIQMSIIPKYFPAFPDRSEIDLFASLIPVKAVGGDLYDFFFIDEDHLCLAIGDVSGKGVPAALFMAVTRTLLRARFVKGQHPQQIVSIINDDLCRDNSQKMFVTFFLGILNVKTGEFDYCNAGHNQPYLYSDGELTQLEMFHGFPLGIKSNTTYRSAKTTLKKDDLLVCYTDGVTEAEDANGGFFEDAQLEKLLLENNQLNPSELIPMIITAVNNFSVGIEQSDDITLLALRYLQDEPGLETAATFFRYTIRIRQNVAELQAIQNELDSLFTLWKISEEVINDYQLAFEELLTNIIYYAFAADDENIITISINFEDGEIRTQIEDDGLEFNPLNTEDPSIPKSIHGVKPGGLGIFICKKILDKIEYTRKDGKNILTFSKFSS
ncbi:MAG: SpoIIE family protein phosphatase [Ignavibacteriales bacterium]|nr:SpoIIE family protein phosphatase [Ignavibacteriales bacterium]